MVECTPGFFVAKVCHGGEGFSNSNDHKFPNKPFKQMELMKFTVGSHDLF